ncbi:MAG: hypothetical protein KY476_20050, partial [Planctomycetes bacterium]|nr:hypothetical protein [Planctomycetota bacterium]
MLRSSRREFLAHVGRGMLIGSVGSAVALDLGLAPAFAGEPTGRLTFGEMEPLVALMQETPLEKLSAVLVQRINSGTKLETLVTAAALANARTFGGQDYVGFHTFMALAPALEMARELPKDKSPLPVLKVLYRNTDRIQQFGGAPKEVLHAVGDVDVPTDLVTAQTLRDEVRAVDWNDAEGVFAAAVARLPVGEAYNHLQYTVQDETDVHRVVLAWRAWSAIDLVGSEHAHTLLRQSVRYCLHVEDRIRQSNRPVSEIRTVLPRLLDQYNLEGRPLGKKQGDDAWLEELAGTVFSADRAAAADAVAQALAAGYDPEHVGEALSVAANLLILHDPGRDKEYEPSKPVGSVHGDSVGVHASDAANAWRNIARVSNPRNVVASLIVGAYHTAGQSGRVRPERWPLDAEAVQNQTDPAALLAEADAAIRRGDQARAAAAVERYAEVGAKPRPVFDLLLKFATSEDGALHAEKYYRTVTEEFRRTRPSVRWRQLVGLARVSASEYGRPAPGYQQASQLLK